MVSQGCQSGVDLRLMLLCWLREYTEGLAKWATDVGPEPGTMIERGRQREGEREDEEGALNPLVGGLWDCKMWLFS